MKVWELSSACREEPQAVEQIFGIPEWREYAEWLRNVDQLVQQGDRTRLDHELPDELCRTVLESVSTRYQVSEGYIRVARLEPTAGELSALQVFDRYGGSFLEGVNEAGLASVPSCVEEV